MKVVWLRNISKKGIFYLPAVDTALLFLNDVTCRSGRSFQLRYGEAYDTHCFSENRVYFVP